METQFKSLFEQKDNGLFPMCSNSAMMSPMETHQARPGWSAQDGAAYLMYATGRLNARFANLSGGGLDEHAEGLRLEAATR